MNEIKIVTHNKHFHPDDVFAVATLLLVLGDKKPIKIIRTRNPLIIASADYVVDVGGEYDAEKNRFDHHQKGGAGQRGNGIPYASFGLVWKKYGAQICGSEEIARMIEEKIIESTDATDNGVGIIRPVFDGIYPYSYWNVISSLNPTWKERHKDRDELFKASADSAKSVISREIEIARHFIEGRGFVETAYENAEDKRLIVLENEFSWKKILNKYKEPLFVVEPNFEEGTWVVTAIKDDPHSFINRKDMPKKWAGKKDKELVMETNVKDALFCHNNLFIAAAHSKEGAIKLSRLAIES